MQPGSFSDVRRGVHKRHMFQCLLICISLATLYCINLGSLYFPQPLLLGLVMCVALECHACGAVAWFSNIPYARCAAARWCLQERPFTTPSLPRGIGARRAAWRATVVLQIIIVISPTLYSIIVLADDPRRKRRTKGNSTSDRTKKRLSLSICFKCPSLDI